MLKLHALVKRSNACNTPKTLAACASEHLGHELKGAEAGVLGRGVVASALHGKLLQVLREHHQRHVIGHDHLRIPTGPRPSARRAS